MTGKRWAVLIAFGLVVAAASVLVGWSLGHGRKVVRDTANENKSDIARLKPKVQRITHNFYKTRIINGQRGSLGKPGPFGRRGATGRDGADGTPGDPGTNGIDGEDGVPGDAGSDGAAGRDGVDGKDGAPGKDGVDGAQGPPGTSPTTGTCEPTPDPLDDPQRVNCTFP